LGAVPELYKDLQKETMFKGHVPKVFAGQLDIEPNGEKEKCNIIAFLLYKDVLTKDQYSEGHYFTAGSSILKAPEQKCIELINTFKD